MKSSELPKTIYARFYNPKVIGKLFAKALATDLPLSEIVEEACGFALSHPSFKLEKRECAGEKAVEAKRRRQARYKKLAGL